MAVDQKNHVFSTQIILRGLKYGFSMFFYSNKLKRGRKSIKFVAVFSKKLFFEFALKPDQGFFSGNQTLNQGSQQINFC